MTPLEEWSARRRNLYLYPKRTKQTNIHAPGGIFLIERFEPTIAVGERP
jgi:hypothetical protein